jgi:hypothetical protein
MLNVKKVFHFINVATVIFRMNVFWGFRRPCTDQTVGGKGTVKDVNARMEGQCAIYI